MNSPLYNPHNMGAIPEAHGCSFRVWAPHATSVSVVGNFNEWNGAAHPLRADGNGFWAGFVPEAEVGDPYKYEIKNGDKTFQKNDPYARSIDPDTRNGVIYDFNFKKRDPSFQLPAHSELVIYELHVGTYAPKGKNALGGFADIVKKLPYLKSLGVNVLELMPPVEFPSERSWGYNPTNPFAVEASYGGPEGLKKLIDAAHDQGIGVILDIVYNHFGPDDLDLWQFDGWNENNLGGIYFFNDWRSSTPWGENRPDYGRGEVRQFIRDNALMWFEEFEVDGLRLDSTLWMRDAKGNSFNPDTQIPTAWSLLQWINEEVAHHFPGKIMIAEDLASNPWVTKTVGEGGAGFNAQWDAAFVHPLRHAVTILQDEQRQMGGVVIAIANCYHGNAFARVIYSESHDEVANGKARVPSEISPGDPTSAYAQRRSTLAAGILFTSAGIPMIFQGQEFLEDGWFKDDEAVDWSKLEAHKGITALYRDLIQLRLNHHGHTGGLKGPHAYLHHVNHDGKVVAYHRWAEGGAGDDVLVLANFSNQTYPEYRIGFPRAGRWLVRLNSDWEGYSPTFTGSTPPSVEIVTGETPYDGFPQSGVCALGPYSLLILSQSPD